MAVEDFTSFRTITSKLYNTASRTVDSVTTTWNLVQLLVNQTNNNINTHAHYVKALTDGKTANLKMHAIFYTKEGASTNINQIIVTDGNTIEKTIHDHAEDIGKQIFAQSDKVHELVEAYEEFFMQCEEFNKKVFSILDK